MADPRIARYRSSEKDWPVLLHVMVRSRYRGRTDGWMAFVDTRPPNPVEDRLRVSYSSDAYITTPSGLIAVMQSLTGALVRQQELLQSISE